MRTVGIIVEYNPLHNGHIYHFQEARKISNADAVIAVMSGHFLQRGEPALMNKWARTELALQMGVDVVIELPVAYSSAPAEWFAYGAVSALHASGVTDSLCFGSESGSIEWLQALAKLLQDEPPELRQRIRRTLKNGGSYPDAFSSALQSYALQTSSLNAYSEIQTDALALPNNTLGLHYLIALERLHSPITPLSISRTKSGYNDTSIHDRSIASATAIRNLLLKSGRLAELAPYIPPYTLSILQREADCGRSPVTWESLSQPLFQAILSKSVIELSQIAEVSEGLEHRIKDSLSGIAGPCTIEGLLSVLKTKRYTRTKLQRVLTRILLGHAKSDLDTHILRHGVPYLRVLGFTNKGRELLKRMNKTATVPVITNVGQGAHPLLQLDIQATGIYSLAYESLHAREMLRDYYEPPIYLSDR